MAKTAFFCIAVAGLTVDGREITRDMIQQMADSYDPATYTARINCEHLRGYSPEPPFNSWGSVTAVKSDTVELTIGGKKEKRLALFGQFDVTDQAKAYNQAGQKLFSSVEVQPNFSGTGKAYLVGCAFTDSPASIGTEVLKFSRDEKRKDNLLYVAQDPIELSFEEGESAASIADGVFNGLRKFADMFKPQEPVKPETKPEAKPETGAQGDFAAFQTQLADALAKFSEDLTGGIQKGFAALETRVAKQGEDIKALQAQAEATPSRNYSARPKASGGNGAVRAEC